MHVRFIRWITALAVGLLASGPLAALTWHPNVADASFNSGLYYADRFAAPATHNMVSERIVRLDNGDVIVAGRVTYLNPQDPAGRMWLGLVRYNAAGVRQTWGSGADTAFTYFNRQYLIYPKGSAAKFTRIADIISYGNFLYVLAEGDASIGGNGQRNVWVMVFRTSDGEFQNIYGAFTRSEDEYGAGLVPIDAGFGGTYLLAVGTKISASGVQRPTFRRFGLQYGSGVLSEDNTIDPGNGGYRDVAFPNAGFCDTGACSGSAYAVKSYGGGFSPLGIYVGGTLLKNNGETEFLLLKVNANASLDPSFNGSGMKRVRTIDTAQLPLGQGYLYDLAVVQGDAFNSATDRIYPLGSRDDPGRILSTVAKVHGDGTLDPNFGYIGKGYASVGLNVARSIAVIGNDIVVAGQSSRVGAIAVIDNNLTNPLTTQALYLSYYQPRRADGSIWGDSVFHDIVVASNSRIVATGDMRDNSAGGTLLLGTIGIVVDRIFANGFQN
ncbi:MAG: hypothetical protein ABI650_03425 [Dokdonella sp.]